MADVAVMILVISSFFCYAASHSHFFLSSLSSLIASLTFPGLCFVSPFSRRLSFFIQNQTADKILPQCLNLDSMAVFRKQKRHDVKHNCTSVPCLHLPHFIQIRFSAVTTSASSLVAEQQCHPALCLYVLYRTMSWNNAAFTPSNTALKWLV